MPVLAPQGSGLLAVVLTVVVLGAFFAIVARSPARPRVLVVGDSRVRLLGPAARAVFGDRYRVDVWSHDGWRIDQIEPSLARLLTPVPSAVVLDWGTNDVIQDNVRWQSAWDRAIVALNAAGVRCVVLTTVGSDVVDYGQHGSRVRDGINARIAALHRADGTRWYVTDWNRLLRARGLAVTFEGIHENGNGAQILARDDGAAIDRCLS